MKALSRSNSVNCLVAVAAVLVASTGIAVAAEPPAKGFYAGALVGAASFEDDGMFSGYKSDDSSVGYAVFGGYKFLRYLAVEARLLGLGSYSVEDSYYFGKIDYKVGAISGHVVGIVPFGRSGWELFGQLGLASVKVDADCCDDDYRTAGSAGLGVRFYPTPHVGLSLQTDAYAYEEDTYYKTYDQGVVTTQFGFQYLF